MHRIAFVALAGLVLSAVPAAAQTPGPEVVKLVVQPAAVPSPALKYRLLPDLRDLHPGNAALFYQRAHSPEWQHALVDRAPGVAQYSEWLDLPSAKLPVEKLKHLRDNPMLREVDRAARMESCDWQL